MCTEYYVNGVEITRGDKGCWCPLTDPVDSKFVLEARLDLAAAILDALENVVLNRKCESHDHNDHNDCGADKISVERRRW